MKPSHSSRGQAAESVIEQVHENYILQRRVRSAIRLQPPFRIVGPVVNGYTRVQLLGKGPVDWLIQMTDGRTLVFDVKSTIADRWKFSELPEKQAAILDAFDPPGGSPHSLAGVMLCLAGRWFWLRWGATWVDGVLLKQGLRYGYSMWRDKSMKAPASLTAEEAAFIGVEFGMGDWIGAVR